MKITIVTCLFTERDMNIDARHSGLIDPNYKVRKIEGDEKVKNVSYEKEKK